MDSKIPTKGRTDQMGSMEPRYIELSVAKHVEGIISSSNNVICKINKFCFISFIQYFLIFKFVKEIIFPG